MFSFRGSSPRWKNRSKPSHACSGWVVLPLLLKHQPDGHVPWSWVSAPLRDLFVGMKEFNWQERPTLPPPKKYKPSDKCSQRIPRPQPSQDPSGFLAPTVKSPGVEVRTWHRAPGAPLSRWRTALSSCPCSQG